MVSVEEDCFVNCPHCLESIAIRVDMTAGQDQYMVYDCEVCCRPIAIRFFIDEDGVISFESHKE